MRKLLILLVAVFTMASSVFAEDAANNGQPTAKDINSSFSDVKKSTQELIESLESAEAKEALAAVGQEQLEQLKGTLANLKGLLDNQNSAGDNDLIRNATDEVKKQFESLASLDALKDNEYFKGLADKFGSFKGDANSLISNLDKLVEFGFSGNMPLGIIADYGGIGVKLYLDNLVMHRGDQPNSITDDYTTSEAGAEINLPFLPKQDDGSHAIRFTGNVSFQHGSKDVSLNKIRMEKSKVSIPIFKNKVWLELIDEENTPPSQLGLCKDNSTDEDAKEKKQNYIAFDCKEIKEVNLVGRFKFNPAIIRKTDFDEDASNNPNDPLNKKDTNKTGDNKDGNENATDQTNAPANTTNTPEGATTNDDKQASGKEGDKSADVADSQETVYAYFRCNAKGGVVASVCFSSPFELTKVPGFKFKAQNAVVDLSDLTNSNGITFPKGYWDDEDLDIANWMGFFLKELSVKFPKEWQIGNASESESPVATARNVIIDDYGLTGEFEIDNLASFDMGNEGANVGIDKMYAELLKGEFQKGELVGSVTIPFLEEYKKQDDEKPATTEDEVKNKKHEDVLKLEVIARVGLDAGNADRKYSFFASTKTAVDKDYKVPFTDLAYISVYKGAGIEFSNESQYLQDTDKKLMFALTLNGALNMASAENSSSKGSRLVGYDAKFEGIEFQGLRFCNVGSQKISIQAFALKGDLDCRLMGMGLTVNRLGWNNGVPGANGELEGRGLDIDAHIHLVPQVLTPELAGLFKTAFNKGKEIKDKVKEVKEKVDEAKKQVDQIKNSDSWSFMGIDLHRIALDANFSAFHFKGLIDVFKDDEKFGKGFRGTLDLGIDPLDLTVGMQACFGKTTQDNTEFNYWFTKATADMSGLTPPIMLFPPSVYLKSITGGAYYQMEDKSAKSIFSENGGGSFQMADVTNYEPKKDVLGFIAGIGAYVASEKTANAEAELNVSFYTGGHFALKKIQLGGNFSMLNPKMSAKFQKLNNVAENMQKVTKFAQNQEKENVLSNLKDFFIKKDNDGQKLSKETKAGSISGWVNAEYVREDSTFDCKANVNVDLYGLITGNGSFELHIEPSEWHMYVGRWPAGGGMKPVNLKFLSVGDFKTYFMLGHLPAYNLDPLNSDLSKRFGLGKLYYTGKSESFDHAKGFAFAVDGTAAVTIGHPKFASASAKMSAGCDLSVTDKCYIYKNEKKTWRGNGSVYAYVGLDAGVNPKIILPFLWFCLPSQLSVFNGESYVELSGQVPAPIVGHAKVKISLELFDFLKMPTLDLDFTVGEDHMKEMKECDPEY